MNEFTVKSQAFDVESFGKVAVVMGGWSAEREVSLMSGQQVFDALTSVGVNAHAVDAGRDIVAVMNEGRFDRAFLILHGRGGEDGIVQGALELAGIPYTGSGVLASALCMDKWRAKVMVSLQGVDTPEAAQVRSRADARQNAERIGYPLVIKPVREGSSIGVSMVDDLAQLDEAWEKARRYGSVMLEKRLTGMEVTASIIGDVALPLISMRGSGEFYDYQAKYLAEDTLYQCPADLPEQTVSQIQQMALMSFAALGCRSWGRVDFMLDKQGRPYFIECNTAPGMTSHSLVPMAAQEAGVSFASLCLQILADTCVEESLA